MNGNPENSGGRHALLKKGIYILSGVILGLVFLCAAYRVIRTTAARVSRDFMSPFLRSGSVIAGKLHDKTLLTRSKNDLALSVVYLQRRVARLEAENASIRRADEENKQLRKLLDIPEKKNFKPVFAGIIARKPSAWRQYFTIGKGFADGIRIGDAVASMDAAGRIGFAGRILECTRHTATASTLYAPECRVSVSLDSGETGGIEYSEADRCPMVTYLPCPGDYRAGKIFFTSGQSGLSPEGLPVGVIRKMPDGQTVRFKNNLNAEVLVTPFVPVDRIRFVAVFTRKHTGKGK